MPIVLAGTFTGALKPLRTLGRVSDWIEKVTGAMIVVVGLYLLWIA